MNAEKRPAGELGVERDRAQGRAVNTRVDEAGGHLNAGPS